MSATLVSGSYRESAVTSGLRQMMASLFGRSAPRHAQHVEPMRLRLREANEVRELARSVERENPGFASDLYAAAARHEGLED